ncbi:GLPGLI family protein [Porphyromonas pogonae]|uniref:GLPGLI family protein n=1 Tax=Porphyromonas pogonae TaxID=867595 RepID=UPI002E784E50|nr:GLPGLI family protein [Porphyromonas pogonae]
MNKFFTIVLLVFSLSMISSAQKKMMYRSVEKVGEASLLCYYIYSHSEQGVNERVLMLLQTGHNIQKFGSYANYLRDSLGLHFNNQPQDTRLLSYESSKILRLPSCQNDVDWTLYINYPENKETITDRVFSDSFISKEEILLPSWNYSNETKKIGAYLCCKSTTQLYGRDWVVWYAPSIERPDGPWLLRGLPGIVVEAEDSRGEFKFELHKIERRETPIVFNKKQYFEANRNIVLKTKLKYYDNRAQYVNGTSLGGSKMINLPATPAQSYNPLRRIEK